MPNDGGFWLLEENIPIIFLSTLHRVPVSLAFLQVGLQDLARGFANSAPYFSRREEYRKQTSSQGWYIAVDHNERSVR